MAAAHLHLLHRLHCTNWLLTGGCPATQFAKASEAPRRFESSRGRLIGPGMWASSKRSAFSPAVLLPSKVTIF